ncbi:MAG: DUF445 family protein [Treponema sp.]|jgi:hypothetical protein|nr:DUF445 family protein [Treponema sp.]
MIKILIVWLIPPVIGAVIGYVTNALAIKMLFRPLTEKRLWGIRIPFTPGILPRQRHELAQSIGRMVERELLTPEIVRQRLRREDVRSGIRGNVALFTEKVCTAPLSSFLVQGDGAAAREQGGVMSRLLEGFFQSPAFEVLFERLWSLLAEKGGETFGGKTIRELIGDEPVEDIRKNMEHALTAAIRQRSGGLAGQLGVMLCTMFPRITAMCVDFLNRRDVKQTLEAQGRIFLSGAIKKLGGIQRFFISLGGYDVTLSQKMPEIIGDLINQLKRLLENPEEQRKIAEFITNTVERLLSDEENGERIAKTALDVVITYADTPLKDMFPSFFNGGSPEAIHAIGKRVFSSLTAYLAGAEDADAGALAVKETRKAPDIAEFFTTLLKEHPDWTLASVFLITPDKKDALDAFICERLVTLADEQIANVLQSINIRLLVAERIDELDMIRVEGIILDIMADQLTWINVLGAILGAFIGTFQAAFSWFTRGL